MDAAPATVLLAIILVAVVGAFLILRELMLWYFRLNEIANNIAYIANHYRALDNEAKRVASPPSPNDPAVQPPPTPRALPQPNPAPSGSSTMFRRSAKT